MDLTMLGSLDEAVSAEPDLAVAASPPDLAVPRDLTVVRPPDLTQPPPPPDLAECPCFHSCIIKNSCSQGCCPEDVFVGICTPDPSCP